MGSDRILDLKSQFDKLGFIHVPGVLSDDEVLQCRTLLNDSFAQKGGRALSLREILELPGGIPQLPFKDKAVKALQQVLGENYIVIPDFHVHRNIFPPRGKGWHEDSGSEGSVDYLKDDSYLFAKCGIYLQDNTYEWGGGIKIVPGGHKFPIKTPFSKFDFKLKSLINRKLGGRFKSFFVPIKAGDMVAFDCRLPHSGTSPESLIDPVWAKGNMILNIPADKTKLVFYWNAAATLEGANNYMLRSEERAMEDEISKLDTEFFFSDFIRFSYPKDYPDDLVSVVKNNKLTIAALPEPRTEYWRKVWEEKKMDNPD